MMVRQSLGKRYGVPSDILGVVKILSPTSSRTVRPLSTRLKK